MCALIRLAPLRRLAEPFLERPVRFHRRCMSALFEAAAQGQTDKVRFELSRGAWVNQTSSQKITPLFAACARDHAETAKLLIAEGGAVNQATEDGRTPLLAAIEEGHAEVVKLLIAAGADVDHQACARTTCTRLRGR